jgi:SagB-type dehydrogenase family enzyme
MTSLLSGPGRNPVRWPRLRRGLAVATVPDGLLVEGGPSRQLLGGAAAASLLPRLLPRLDGTCEPGRLAAEFSLSRAQLGQALDLLDGCGLLEWVQPDGPAGFAAEHVAAYMSRTIGVNDSCPSADDLAVQLESATVVLVAPPVLAQAIAEDLTETGVGSVQVCAVAEAVGMPSPTEGRRVAAVFDDPSDEDDSLALVVAACREHDVPVLRFSAAAGHVEVGPAFGTIETACVSCYRKGQVPGAEAAAELWDARTGAAGMLAGLVTSALLGMLTHQPPLPSPRQLARTSLPLRVTEVYSVVPDLECACCAGGAPPQDPDSRDVLTYEWRMAKVPLAFEVIDAPTPARRDLLTMLQRQRENFPGSPRYQLPEQQAVTRQRGMDESALGAILARTAGFRTAGGPDRRRWAPSGGNMASVCVYLCTEAGLFGLPGTIYRYDDIEHEILSVHADHVPLARVLDGTGLDSARTDIAVILVGAAGRLSQKYGDFAWRLTHLDTGCAALQFQLVAVSYGLSVTFAPAWPAQLSQMLELDPDREVVTAVASLCAAPDGRTEG